MSGRAQCLQTECRACGGCRPVTSLPLYGSCLRRPRFNESHHCVQVAQLNMTECIMTWKTRGGGSIHLLIGSAGYARPSVKLLQGNGQWTHGRTDARPHTQPSALGCGGQTSAAGGSGRLVNACVPPSNASAGTECLIVHKDSYTRRRSTWVHRTGRGEKNPPTIPLCVQTSGWS